MTLILTLVFLTLSGWGVRGAPPPSRHNISNYKKWMALTNPSEKWKDLPVLRFNMGFGLINYDGTCRYHCEGTNVTNKK
jgi:hypothetical protein